MEATGCPAKKKLYPSENFAVTPFLATSMCHGGIETIRIASPMADSFSLCQVGQFIRKMVLSCDTFAPIYSFSKSSRCQASLYGSIHPKAYFGGLGLYGCLIAQYLIPFYQEFFVIGR